MVERYLVCNKIKKGIFSWEREITFYTINKNSKCLTKCTIHWTSIKYQQTSKRFLINLESIETRDKTFIISLKDLDKYQLSYFEVPKTEIIEYYGKKENYPNYQEIK